MSNYEPKVAAIFITYNQKAYVVDALQSIFDQSYQNFEIIISDDCSTDGTYEVLDSIVSNYQGPHKICLNRSSKNIGIGANTQSAINLSDADFYITCDGDDISHKDRFEKIIEFFKSENCDSNLLASNAISMKKMEKFLRLKYLMIYQKLNHLRTYLISLLFFLVLQLHFQEI